MNQISGSKAVRIPIACLGACAVLALGGCANLQWQKADADAVQTDHDLELCQQKAALSARRLSSTTGQFATVVGGPGGPVTIMTPSPGANTDLAAQQSMLSDCMRAQGYRLVREK